MISIVATKTAQKWMKENLAKYATQITNKNIKAAYAGKTKAGNFTINVYSTNLTTITGSYEARIYKQLVLNSGEFSYTGCDEVGVGDFFGPVVFASVTLDEASLEYIATHPLNIRDSKKLEDYEILNIYATLKEKVTHKIQVVYDRDVDATLNSISMKSYYHNLNLQGITNNAIIDLYTTENAFNKYTQALNLQWPNPLILETKADGKFLSVALASIFARAKFIQEMDNLDSKYNFSFPYGANNVINPAKDFVAKYSKAELATFCKTSFKTFDEI